MTHDRVKYKMIDHDRGIEIWLETDPIGWDESEKTIKRSMKTFGIWTELSKNLRFVGEGADLLRLSYIGYDIEGRVSLEEWRSHPIEDKFYLHSTGTFDLSGYESDEVSVKVPFKTGGFNALIKSQMSEKFELDRLKSINEKTIDALVTKRVGLNGRKIFLVTTWDSDNVNTNIGDSGDQNYKLQVQTNAGNERHNISSIPIRILGQSHEGFAGTPIPSYLASWNANNTGTNYQSSAAFMFFLNSDQERTFKLTFDYDYNVYFQQYENVQWCRFRISLVVFENGLTLDYKRRHDVLHSLTSQTHSTTAIIDEQILPHDNDAALFQFSHRMTGSYSTTITIQAGESLSMEQWLASDMYPDGVGTRPNAGVRVYIQDNISNLKIEEESYFAPTETNVVLMHDAGEKLLQIITGKKLKFKSEFYGRIEIPNTNYAEDGEFSRTGIAPGLWIRGDESKKIQFSLKEFIETTNVIHNVGYTIETLNDEDIFVMEDMKYFFRDETAIILTEQVSNVRRKAAKEFHYANSTFGYKNPSGDNLYEEAMALDEYNTQLSYAHPITRVDTKYNKVSPSRADSYGQEFARRKSLELFPEEDSRYDKTTFLLDLKTTFGTSLAERLWADDYSQAPTGVFSPETATNLRLTPFRISERHHWFFGSGLRKFPKKSITYSNTIIRSNLGTKKTGEVERFENGDFLISEMERPRFVNEWVEFDYEVDFFVNQQVFGTTNINGREIPNYFCKVQFINENGLKEYGYLFELKPNNEGKWKLLKAI